MQLHARPRAFTLIELLIVVAIIAILAAIAVPNFLEAQTRSKVSRVRADLRTIATSIESYSVDYSRPPYDGEPGFAHRGWATTMARMTSPVAYMTSVPADLFQDEQLADTSLPGETHFVSSRRHAFDYATAHWEDIANNPAQKARWDTSFGNSRWKLTSAGPDRTFMGPGSFFGFEARYDPTNGTVSAGDIVRSQGLVQ
jgi:prepilin-type N-terminal cleavage/methylation domain-containing protein